MTPREILAKYGLATDVKSVRERLNGQPRFHGLVNEELEEALKTYSPSELLRLWRKADIDLLCEMAERAEKVEELLGLYRTVRKQVEEYKDAPNKNPRVLHIALDIHETLEQIDELEKELEKLK